MNSSTRLRQLAATAVAAGAMAAGALALTAPAAQADTFQHHCTTAPQDYATGAVTGVYSTERVGQDRYEVCKVYDSSGKLLGTTNVPNYGFYSRHIATQQVPPRAAQVQQ
ncbi:hypothetical protein ACXPWS_26590 [Mycobacterium sp. BMJ-28]